MAPRGGNVGWNSIMNVQGGKEQQMLGRMYQSNGETPCRAGGLLRKKKGPLKPVSERTEGRGGYSRCPTAEERERE